MAAITGAVIAAGSAAYGVRQQGRAGREAARGADAAAQLSREQYEQQRRDQMPWLQAGQNALTQLGQLNEGDYSSFTESPDYQFAREQGIQGVDRSAAARGTQYSGGQLAALADYSGGLASQNYNTYYNRIANLAGVGQTAASNIGAAGSNYAANAGNAIMAGANARADARVAQASTYGQLGNRLGDAFGQWYQQRNDGYGVNPISAEQWQSAYANIPAANQYAWRGG